MTPAGHSSSTATTQAIYDVCNCDNSSYNSLQMKLQKRVTHGLDFLLTYTWSKALD